MNFCIIGTINSDHAIFSDGSETHGFGGIFYSIMMLRHLINDNDQIIPICNTGNDIYELVLSEFEELGKIETRYIKKINQKNTTVKLIYQDKENRDEYISHLAPQLELKQLLQPDSVDAYLVNFITGMEMALPTFREFCQKVKSPIFMDFHSLSLGIAEDGRRFYRYPKLWREWISDIDVLQLNEREAANILQIESPKENELRDFAASLLNHRLKIVNLTRGAKGSILAYENEGKIFTRVIDAYPVEEVVDVTGSGDAFMAGFICHFMKFKNAEKAAIFANKVAGLKCTRIGAEGIREITSIAFE